MKTWKSELNKTEADKELEEFLYGDDILLDQHLVKWDSLTMIAHQIMLNKIGILSKKELSKVLKILLGIYKNGLTLKPELEDVHSNIEHKLIQKLGIIGKKTHTFKSRNDQVATDLKLYMKDELIQTGELLIQLEKALLEKANANKNIVMPGYTHYQQAMPYTFASYMMAYFHALMQDIELLLETQKILDKNPLGAAAGFGTSKKVDKNITTQLLGFKEVQHNSLSAINSRGKDESMLVFVLSQIMLNINKIAEDLILFSTKEYGFIELPDEFCTGSSIMPQKKNPDTLELIKGKTSEVISNLFQMMSVIKNLPSGYNKDTMTTKASLIKSVKITKAVLAIMTKIIDGIKPNAEKMKAGLSNDIFATSYANSLAEKGMPYKTAYKQAASMVAQGKSMPEFDAKDEFGDYKAKYSYLSKKVYNVKKDFENAIKHLTGLSSKKY